MAKIMTMGEVVLKSVRVIPGTMRYWPQHQKEEAIDVMECIPKFPRCYAVNNSTVAYIYEDAFYVTPYTTAVINTLKSEGFKQEDFTVPFSSYDYPARDKEYWEKLREEARKSYEEEFSQACMDYCDKHDIYGIPDDILAKCFEIPATGMKVRHPRGYEKWEFPLVNVEVFDDDTAAVLGKYDNNNGKVVFVYRNGRTYVARGYNIIAYLRVAGYKPTDFHVPLSNWEEIQDPELKARWDKLSKI